MRGFYKYIRAFAARQPDCARSGAMRPNFGYCSHAIRLRVIFGLLRVFNAEEI